MNIKGEQEMTENESIRQVLNQIITLLRQAFPNASEINLKIIGDIVELTATSNYNSRILIDGSLGPIIDF